MKKETLLYKKERKKERKKPYLLASNSNGAPEKNLSSIEIKTSVLYQNICNTIG